MFGIVWIVHVLLCAFLVILVMLQQGKGADAGAITSASSSDSILGAGGAGNLLTRLTTGLAITFMVTSIILVKSYNSRSAKTSTTVVDPLQNSVMGGETEAEVDKEKAAEPVAEGKEAAPAGDVAGGETDAPAEAAPVEEKAEEEVPKTETAEEAEELAPEPVVEEVENSEAVAGAETEAAGETKAEPESAE